MDAEAAYLAALGAVDQAGNADGCLVLSGGDVELRFRPLPEVPASDLEDTRWILETLLDGEVASSTTGLPAVLELADDGTLSASTGCPRAEPAAGRSRATSSGSPVSSRGRSRAIPT